MPKILLVEDDPFHDDVIQDALRQRWSDVVIRSIRTEKQFYSEFEAIADGGFDLIILDQMLPWTTEDDTEEDSAIVDGPLRAGNRCSTMLRDDKRTRDIPQIFFTNLVRNTVPEEVSYVRKKDSEALTKLVREAEQQIHRKI